MRSPVLLIFTKNTSNICLSKFHILIWVMVQIKFGEKCIYLTLKSVRDKNVFMESLKYVYIN
jgi:hypothetical protein